MGMVIRKFGEDQTKTPPVEIYSFFKFPVPE